MKQNMAIGLSGYASSGKTTAANYIVSNYGFTRLHIADPIRAMISVLMEENGISEEMRKRYLEGDLKDGVIIPEFGRTSRDMQITLGTPWGRKLVGDGLWLNTWKRKASQFQRVINDSVRFPNEEDAIRDLGGFSILIERPGVGPAKFNSWAGRKLYKITGLHYGVDSSERIDLLEPDDVINNNGTLDFMYRQIDDIMGLNDISKNVTAS